MLRLSVLGKGYEEETYANPCKPSAKLATEVDKTSALAPSTPSTRMTYVADRAAMSTYLVSYSERISHKDTHLAVELSNDLIIPSVLDICLSLVSELEVCGRWSITVSEGGVIESRVGQETVENLYVS